VFARLRSEVPHLKYPPSYYIKRNFWFTTQPIEEPSRPSDLLQLLERVGWDRLLFSTDYPHWDFDDPRSAFKAPLSEAQRRQVLTDNAAGFYGLG
jgi:predicted TIM-barrel fold metal-dependent hydrolase